MDISAKGRRITEQYCSELLNRFDKKLKETRPHLAKENVLFQYDKA